MQKNPTQIKRCAEMTRQAREPRKINFYVCPIDRPEEGKGWQENKSVSSFSSLQRVTVKDVRDWPHGNMIFIQKMSKPRRERRVHPAFDRKLCARKREGVQREEDSTRAV